MPGPTFRPINEQQVQQAVAWALAEGESLEILGEGSKSLLGNPLTESYKLDMRGMVGVISHEPSELVLTARAGTSLSEIKKHLKAANQHLAFEPPDLGPLLGGNAGGGTIGGAVACNLSGPRRPMAGALRDHLLGMRGVSGRGEIFKAGGQVVKNVTGFDLSKLMAGSFGSLVVLTEMTLKVLPAPQVSRTLMLKGLNETDAVALMTALLGSAQDPTGAAHLPGDVVGPDSSLHDNGETASLTLIRLEGTLPSVEARQATVRQMASPYGQMAVLDGPASRMAWKEIRDGLFFAGDETQVWRLSLPPSDAPAVVTALKAIPGARLFLDWGGGLIWLSLPSSDDACHQTVRAALVEERGQAMLIRADEAVRARVPVFHPQAPAVAALSERVRRSFDPNHILNRGRMGGPG
ncbi:glycolate oxidase subunit GlcE [Magnetospira sp. QH-2]|uniref:glycolate oxidase subunit GlcE n=1 Tax=Magnetospira sp. (strain QH-2) TaxID=1288970 RepID=UPI0003E81020|nr:glycolate oxidase subunit GlcE [Magnetospira sp. QH-2]CCQ72517.1 glycolate oxidase, subunit GlcE [Magnetospira sp. QH-2]